LLRSQTDNLLVYNGNMTQATDFEELTKILETLVRKVVREELANFARENGMFYLAPGSPLYNDMEKILERKVKEQPKLYKHGEVWGK
jgi:hypothetical protein